MRNLAHFNNIRSKIISLLSNAEKEVLIAMAWFTNEELFRACLQCLQRGVKVKLVLLDDLINHCDFGVDFNLFIAMKGSQFYLYPQTKKFLHHKFCIIDGNILITGSYNWTNYAEYRNLENIVVSDDLALIEDYKNYFDNIVIDLKPIKEFNRINQSEIAEREFIERIGDIAQEVYSLPKSKFQWVQKQFDDRRILAQTVFPKHVNTLNYTKEMSESKDREYKNQIELIKIYDFRYPVSKYNIGFKANLLDQGGREGLKVMIEKGQALPYTITRDAQSNNPGESDVMSSKCECYYGETTDLSKCTKFGDTLILTDLPKMKEGEVKFKIIMSLDKIGTLSIKFVCTNTGKGLESKQSNNDFIEYTHS